MRLERKVYNTSETTEYCQRALNTARTWRGARLGLH